MSYRDHSMAVVYAYTKLPSVATVFSQKSESENAKPSSPHYFLLMATYIIGRNLSLRGAIIPPPPPILLLGVVSSYRQMESCHCA